MHRLLWFSNKLQQSSGPLCVSTCHVEYAQVRYIGVSNETSWGVCQFHAAAKARGLPKVQTIQNSYSLLYRGAFETDLAETCAPHNANVSLLVSVSY